MTDCMMNIFLQGRGIFACGRVPRGPTKVKTEIPFWCSGAIVSMDVHA